MKTILVPTDFSVFGNNALKYAIQFALKTKSKLIVYHAYFTPLYDVSSLPETSYLNDTAAEIDEKTELLKKVVDKACKSLKINRKKLNVNFRVSLEIVSSFITEGIMDCAAQTKADMVIMGTHGATGLYRVVFGSNTADLLLHSKIPVLAIPGRYRFKDIKTIIYATDNMQPEAELKKILPLAQALNAEIEVLHMEYNWDSGEEAEKHFKKIKKEISYSKIRFTRNKISIQVPLIDYLKKYMTRKSNTILAMFSTDKKLIDKILLAGSKVEDMAYKLNRPLLAIRKSLV